MSRKWKKTWKGNENLKTQLENISNEVRTTDLAARKARQSSLITGSICAEIRKSIRPKLNDHSLEDNTDENILIKRAAEAQVKLYELTKKCVWEYGLDWTFVRSVWANILEVPEEVV